MPTASPYRAKDGTVTYRVRVRHQGKNTSETFAGKAEADAFCAAVTAYGVDYAISARERHALSVARDRGPTMDQVWVEFLAWKTGEVASTRTPVEYARRYRLAIAPTFAAVPVAEIRPEDVQAWVDAMKAARRLSPKSISDRHGLLHSVMDYAAAAPHNYIAANPCRSTRLPKRHKGVPRGITPAEWEALRSALVIISPDACDVADFIAASGWRWQEAAALSTYDVEDDGHTVHVTVTRVVRREADGLHIVDGAKSDAGGRRIALDHATSLMVRRRAAAAERGGLVFTNAAGKPWRHQYFLTRYWHPARRAANIGRVITPHGLRHAHVYRLAVSGAPLPEIQARIGHASIQTTIDVYGRMIGDVRPDVLERAAAISSTPRGSALPPAP
jgi:integrase